MQYAARGVAPAGPRGPQPGMRQGHPQSKRSRYFIALFDYDPATMSPNPESCDEELPFSEGDTIKVIKQGIFFFSEMWNYFKLYTILFRSQNTKIIKL